MINPRQLTNNFMYMLLTTVVIATYMPCRGQFADMFQVITYLAITLLFFFHGARMELTELISGLTNWRLHTLIFSTTFIFFPCVGLLMGLLLKNYINPNFYIGILFLCALPSTVQSSIAFTSIARGNVAAALCSSSISSILGIFFTPFLLIGLLHNQELSKDIINIDSIISITKQLFIPFITGLLARRFIGSWIDGHLSVVKFFDQTSIILVVYTAFSTSVVQGLWHQFTWTSLAGIVAINIVILSIALLTTQKVSQLLKFSKVDQIAIIFCGSKKSLVNGIPIANILFPGTLVGQIVLPLMLFHQIQLMACSVLARIYSKQQDH